MPANAKRPFSGLSYPGPPHQTNSPKAHHHHPSSSSPWKPTRPSSLKQEEPEIQVIESEDEEEEVLVDDFDGQCCRTYPYNHSKIQRWREGRKEKKEKERKENVGSKHLAHHVQSVKTPTSNPEKSIINSGNKQNEPTSTAAGSIPVGIVSARQRTDQEKQAPGSVCSTMPLPPSGPLVSTHGAPPVSGMGPSTWSSGPPPPWAMAGQTPPGAPPGPSHYGPAPPWAHPAGMPPGMAPPGGIAGPIPMGYQLAKDPMTGQILLIPTDHMGQPPPATPGFGFGGMPPGMPPTSSASQHLHHLMMQQQHMSYMQHQDLMQQQLRHGIPPNRPRVPETITVSDDDDEDCGKEKASNTESEVVPSAAGEPSNLTKESRPPTPLQIKREIVKTEFKTEPPPIPSEPYGAEDEEVDVKSGLVPPSQGVSLVDKAVTIKQERQERGSLSAEEAVVVGEPSIPAGGCEIQPALCPTDSPHTAHPTAQQLVKREIKCEVGESRGGDGTLCEDTKLCAEALLFMSERSTPSTCNEHFAPQLQEPAATDSGEGCEGSEEHEGFEILFKGLQMLAEGSVTADQLSPIQTLSALAGLDLLCSVTRNDTFEYGLSKSLLDGSRLNLGLLCAITAEDYENHLNWVDPIVKLKKTLNVKKYPNQASEKEARDFISMKIKQFTKDHPESLEEEKYDNIKMLAKMVKKIKNMEIMSQLEVDMRLKITELQNTFREKQKCLSKLKTPRKNKNVKNKKGKQRGPGRPKKKKFPNPKAKMGRPRKHPKVVPKMEPLPVEPDPVPEVLKLEKIKEEEREEEEEEEESFPDSDAPPILEPQKHCDEMKSELGGSCSVGGVRGSSLLKPPKLTASSPPPHSHKDSQSSNAAGSGNNVDTRNTTLSTLTSKFMKGKANPFANLLSQLAAPPSATAETDDKEGGGEEDEEDEEEANEEREGELVDYTEDDQREHQEGEEGVVEEDAGSPVGVNFEGPEQPRSVSEAAYGEVERSSSEKSSDDSSSETGSMMSPTRDCSFQFGKTSKLGYGLEAYRHSKKRKADKPKKHSGGSSETIVPKKPKNLFMMMDFQRGFNAKSAEDEYNFDENDEEKSFEYREPQKESPTPSAQLQEQYSASQSQCHESQLQYQEWTDEDGQGSPVKRKHKKSKSSKSKSSKKERQASGTNANNQATSAAGERLENLRSAQLKPSDLKDGLRLLMLQEGKFWPARLNSTKLPDVYGVVMDRQRGNRPIILPRDDILKEAVLEIRPTAAHHLPIGARVCTLWSSALAQLFPGTITTPDEPLPEGHVLVELDDGDSRLVEMSKIRMLPTDYSRVVYDPDPIASLRKRRVSTDSHDSTASHGELRSKEEQIAAARKSSKLADNSFPSEAKKKSKNSEKMKKKHKKCSKHGHHHCHKHKHKRHKSGGEPVASGSKKTHDQKFAIRSPPHPGSRFVKSDQENNAESSEEASHEESDQQNSSDEEGSGSPGTGRTTHHELTPQKGRELWQWSGEGYRRPGGKGKSKKLFFRSIQRGKDSLHVNDCAVFLSTGRSDRPYIGKIEMLWETGNGSMMVKVKWFYHPEEIETCGRKFDLKLPGGLFQSPHTDENSVHTISHECEVLPIKEYSRLLATESKSKAARVGALYYLAGSYDPAGLTVHFQPGVLQSNSDSE